MENYDVLRKVGEGTFGEVFLAKHKATGQLVAMKKVMVKKTKGGIPTKVVREIKSLESVDSPHVLRLFEYFPFGSCIVLILDFMVTDLHQILRTSMRRSLPLGINVIRSIMRMMLNGLSAVHGRSLMHRDVKPSNLLLSAKGVLKLGDFGMARVQVPASEEAVYSHEVATRWYKAPELYYGAKRYTSAIDMWAAGCILGEMLANAPLFPGTNDIDMIYRIFSATGSPSDDPTTGPRYWPEVSSLPDFHKVSFPTMDGVPWSDIIPHAPPIALSLLSSLLTLDPSRRLTAAEALQHPFLREDDVPGDELLEAQEAKDSDNELEYVSQTSMKHHSTSKGEMGGDQDVVDIEAADRIERRWERRFRAKENRAARVLERDASNIRPWMVLAEQDRLMRAVVAARLEATRPSRSEADDESENMMQDSHRDKTKISGEDEKWRPFDNEMQIDANVQNRREEPGDARDTAAGDISTTDIGDASDDCSADHAICSRRELREQWEDASGFCTPVISTTFNASIPSLSRVVAPIFTTLYRPALSRPPLPDSYSCSSSSSSSSPSSSSSSSSSLLGPSSMCASCSNMPVPTPLRALHASSSPPQVFLAFVASSLGVPTLPVSAISYLQPNCQESKLARQFEIRARMDGIIRPDDLKRTCNEPNLGLRGPSEPKHRPERIGCINQGINKYGSKHVERGRGEEERGRRQSGKLVSSAITIFSGDVNSSHRRTGEDNTEPSERESFISIGPTPSSSTASTIPTTTVDDPLKKTQHPEHKRSLVGGITKRGPDIGKPMVSDGSAFENSRRATVAGPCQRLGMVSKALDSRHRNDDSGVAMAPHNRVAIPTRRLSDLGSGSLGSHFPDPSGETNSSGLVPKPGHLMTPGDLSLRSSSRNPSINSQVPGSIARHRENGLPLQKQLQKPRRLNDRTSPNTSNDTTSMAILPGIVSEAMQTQLAPIISALWRDVETITAVKLGHTSQCHYGGPIDPQSLAVCEWSPTSPITSMFEAQASGCTSQDLWLNDGDLFLGDESVLKDELTALGVINISTTNPVNICEATSTVSQDGEKRGNHYDQGTQQGLEVEESMVVSGCGRKGDHLTSQKALWAPAATYPLLIGHALSGDGWAEFDCVLSRTPLH